MSNVSCMQIDDTIFEFMYKKYVYKFKELDEIEQNVQTRKT